jgi:hypothetical protein
MKIEPLVSVRSRNGKVIGVVWKESENDWAIEHRKSGNSFDCISSFEDACEIIRLQQSYERKHRKNIN